MPPCAQIYGPGAEELAFSSLGACPRCDGTGEIRVVDSSDELRSILKMMTAMKMEREDAEKTFPVSFWFFVLKATLYLW